MEDTKGFADASAWKRDEKKRGEAEGDEVSASVDINKHLPNTTVKPQGVLVSCASDTRS